MFHLTRTPKHRKTLVVFGSLLILSQPIFSVVHYIWNETIRPYPADADTLTIPIVSEIFFWLILMPFAIYTIVRTTQHYHSGLRLFDTSTLKRQYLLVNIVFGALLLYASGQLYDIVGFYNLPMLVDLAASVYLILAVRAEVIASRATAQQKS